IVFASFAAQVAAKFSGAVLLGTIDDQRTRHVAERLDGLAAAGISIAQAQMANAGWRLSRSTETVAGRPVYNYTLAVPPDQVQPMGGLQNMEVHLTTMPGALVFAFDRPSMDRVIANATHPVGAFVSQLATPEARQAFESNAAYAAWGMVQDPFGSMSKTSSDAMSQTWGNIHPDAPGLIREAGALMNLCYDSAATVEIRPQGMHCFYQLTLL